MEHLTLSNGISMPAIGLGVYDMYHAEAERAVENALQIGYRLIDTAENYKNESEVGNAVLNSGMQRTELFITTKIANDKQGYDSTLQSFEESLGRLRMDYVDLYLVHWPIRATRKETWKALERIYTEKKARAIGVANYYEAHLDELYEYAGIRPMVNQVEYSPYLQLPSLRNRCRTDSIILQAYTPLVRGKKFQDPALLAIARKYQKTPAQITLRWDIQQGICPIPKSVTRSRLEENFNVFDFSLSPADMDEMNGWNEGLRVCDDPMEYL